VFKPHLATQWGGASPFLGSHAAISRWPLTERGPRPQPRPVVAVHTAAVLTADFTGVQGFQPLPHAQEEAGEVAHLFDPPAEEIAPELWPVRELLKGNPRRDLLHVALHGKFDVQSPTRDGIVLLEKSPAGGATEQFLTPNMLEGGDLQHGPFVFLNACQVAADRVVLGEYGGFASTLLRIGAGGVVAPLWNVKDDVAAACAREFYAATLAPATGREPVPAAEAVRAQRARYTEAAVRAGDPAVSATLIAYQVFGHPRLMLTRS
jgi:CHAT domain-containing protein